VVLVAARGPLVAAAAGAAAREALEVEAVMAAPEGPALLVAPAAAGPAAQSRLLDLSSIRLAPR